MLSARPAARARDERGAIYILLAVTLPVVLVLGALIVDVGNWYVHKRHLQTQVDAAVLAGGTVFTQCFLDEPLANAAIAAEALTYSGDTARGAAYNTQVQTPGDVDVVLNSTAYPPGGTDNSLGLPCDTKFLDAKAWDEDAPLLFGFVPFVPDIYASARVEILKVLELSGLLPWAQPESDPNTVAALFVNEGTGAVIRADFLNKNVDADGRGITSFLNGTSVQLWANDIVDVNAAARTGVVVLTSYAEEADVDLTGATIADVCGQTTEVSCHGGATATSGLNFIRGYAPGVGSAANPHLNAVRMQNLTCDSSVALPPNDQDSAPFFSRVASCNYRVEADIDFGTGAGDPTVSPTFARVWLQTPDCPLNGSNKGCEMTWTGGSTWATSGPDLPTMQDDGRTPISIYWETGGTGPGPGGPGNQPASAPLAPRPLGLVSARGTNAQTGSASPSTRALSAVLAQPSGTLVVTKAITNDDGGASTCADFSFRVDGGAPQAFEADCSNSIPVTGGGKVDVTEVANPLYATTYANSQNTNTTCLSLDKPNGGTVTCTITNNDRPRGTLVVRKTLVNDNGGTSTASDFSFSIDGGPAQPFNGSGQNSVTVAAGTHTVTEPAVAGYTTTYANCANVAVPAGGSATCTITNDDAVSLPERGGTFTNVAYTYTANAESGPVDYISSFAGGIRIASIPSTAPQTVRVEVGLRAPLKLGKAGDPPILLRFASGAGSRNYAVDCDISVPGTPRNFADEILTGCYTPYRVNPTGDCSAYPSPSDLPPVDTSPPVDTWTPDPTPTCAAVRTGDVNAMRGAMHDRYEVDHEEYAACPLNNWPDNPSPTNLPDEDDPRWVTLMVTDFAVFDSGGAGVVPVRKFAGFYVTGWDIGGQTTGCPGINDPHPFGASQNQDNGDVWGYFVTFVIPNPNGSASEEVCAFDEAGVCIAVLTR